MYEDGIVEIVMRRMKRWYFCVFVDVYIKHFNVNSFMMNLNLVQR